MSPQSVREAVPVGTEMTAEVSVRIESTNSSASSSASPLGGLLGLVALRNASPNSSPTSRFVSSFFSSSPLFSARPPSSLPSVPSSDLSRPASASPLSSFPSGTPDRRNELRLASEYLISAGSSPRYCPLPTPSSARTLFCRARSERVPEGSRRATRAVRTSSDSDRTAYGTTGDAARAARDDGAWSAESSFAAPLPMLPALTVSLSRSTSSPHSSGWAAKYPLTISWVGCAQTTADSAPSRRSTADSLVDLRWKDRASRTDERRPNRCGSVRDTVGYDDRIRERASRYSVAEDLSGGVAADGGSVRRHLAGRSPSPPGPSSSMSS
mmetsp:Transcript_11547/g.26311  ORF Transcript_11547/g.26311 Transcript_11547/m.26311 type:complete len:326 (+) Transcript_11547:75-1052(+)